MRNAAFDRLVFCIGSLARRLLDSLLLRESLLQAGVQGARTLWL